MKTKNGEIQMIEINSIKFGTFLGRTSPRANCATPRRATATIPAMAQAVYLASSSTSTPSKELLHRRDTSADLRCRSFGVRYSTRGLRVDTD